MRTSVPRYNSGCCAESWLIVNPWGEIIYVRLSTLLAPTLREDPNDAEIDSHRLMLRAGLVRKLAGASGIYTLLPLGQRVVAHVERIIREEMDAIGGQELRLPVVQPAELWEASGRWAVYGEDMWRLHDRHGRAYCLGPTHEEVITDLVAHEVHSWRQLPLLLYQIQTKYRDEIRPRFGLMRAREFIMKDGYSFHANEADLERTYADVVGAYRRIFHRVGLDYRTVLADPGAIGGSQTHEFMALADAGEAELVSCGACDYAADIEEAEAAPRLRSSTSVPKARGRVATPNARTIEEVAERLSIDPGSIAKLLLMHLLFADGRTEFAAVLVAGDATLNENKLLAAAGAISLRPVTEEEAERLGLPLGFLGPVNLPSGIVLYADSEVANSGPWVVGANVEGYHLNNVWCGRDFVPNRVLPLRRARADDRCPRCGGRLSVQRGIEVGHVFRLGTKYSRVLGANFLDQEGQTQAMTMGCYGIGVTRTVAAVIEQHHDRDGIIWPTSVAPYHAVLLPVGAGPLGLRAQQAAEEISVQLARRGVSAVIDDRDERPGVKFKDADLLGFPVRITLGKALEGGSVELRSRKDGVVRMVPLDAVAQEVSSQMQEETAAPIA